MTKLKKVLATLVLLCVSGGVALASCGGTEVLVNAAVGQMSSSLVASLATTTSSLVAADNLQTNQMIAALRVMVKELQVTGDQVVNTTIETEKSLAHFRRELADKELIDKVVVDFMSQGFDPCGQSAATARLASADNAVRGTVPQRVAAEIEGGGGRYGSVAASLSARDGLHQQMFCTQSEKDAGVCSSVGRLPGGDTNAALIFSSATGSDVTAAKNAVINNIIGLPDNPLAAEASQGLEGQAYMMEKKKKDSFLAFAAYSLKTIQAENEQYKTAMDDRIGMYFGTDKAVQWARDQTSQSERGVLVDLLKIQGIQLKVRERRIRQNLRVEANVAALLELENQQINGSVTQGAVQQVTTAGATAKVR